jgi:alpha-mannosidase
MAVNTGNSFNMPRKALFHRIILLGYLLLNVTTARGQQTWFADGYHGGIYGHYPMWQAAFMVEKLKENPQWSINLEIEPETWDSVFVKDPDNFRALQEYYEEEGRFGRMEFVNPAFAQPYCYNISGESIIRQFRYGMEKIWQYFPHASFRTYSVEEPCFTSSLPQILSGFGFEYAVLRNPNTCWGGYTSAFGKDLVNWIGPDGTSIPAVPRYACEELSKVNTFSTASSSHSVEFIEACFAAGIRYPVGMCFQDAGWRLGPWLENAIKTFYQPTAYTTWTGYMEMIKDQAEPADWAFSQEDVRPGLVWGAQVLQRLTREIRVSENRLIMAEKMAVLDYLYHGNAWPSDDFKEAWRTLMLAQHHDCWIVPYNGNPGDTWADKVSDWTHASDRIADEKIDRLFNLGERSEYRYIRVFNTLGSVRTGLVAVPLPEGLKQGEFSICDLRGEKCPSQVAVQADGSGVLLFEARVPAMGYTTFQLKEEQQQDPEPAARLRDGILHIETAYYSATIDPARGGNITSLLDKKNGSRQLVEQGKALNNLRGYFYMEGKFHGSADSPAWVSILEDGMLSVRIQVEGQIYGSPFRQQITFYKNSPLIDFDLFIDWTGLPGIGAYDQRYNYVAEERAKAFYLDNYKLHLQFPFKGLGDRLFKNAPFDVCESRLNNTIYSRWDSIKHNVILNWVDVSNLELDYGVALFSDHTTSYLNTEDLPLGLTVQFIGKGLWGRNYIIDGPTRLKYALLPHSGDWERGLVDEASNAWNQPLTGRFADIRDEPPERTLLELSGDNLELSSATMVGEDLVVRLFNTSSAWDDREIVWNCEADEILQVDLNGNVLTGIRVETDPQGRMRTSLHIPRFGFQTLKLTHVRLPDHIAD